MRAPAATPPIIVCDIGLSIPSPHVILRARGHRPLMGPSSEDGPVDSSNRSPLERPIDSICAAAPRPWRDNHVAGGEALRHGADDTWVILHVAHVNAVRARSNGANGFSRGPPVSFSETTNALLARSLRTYSRRGHSPWENAPPRVNTPRVFRPECGARTLCGPIATDNSLENFDAQASRAIFLHSSLRASPPSMGRCDPRSSSSRVFHRRRAATHGDNATDNSGVEFRYEYLYESYS